MDRIIYISVALISLSSLSSLCRNRVAANLNSSLETELVVEPIAPPFTRQPRREAHQVAPRSKLQLQAQHNATANQANSDNLLKLTDNWRPVRTQPINGGHTLIPLQNLHQLARSGQMLAHRYDDTQASSHLTTVLPDEDFLRQYLAQKQPGLYNQIQTQPQPPPPPQQQQHLPSPANNQANMFESLVSLLAHTPSIQSTNSANNIDSTIMELLQQLNSVLQLQTTTQAPIPIVQQQPRPPSLNDPSVIHFLEGLVKTQQQDNQQQAKQTVKKNQVQIGATANSSALGDHETDETVVLNYPTKKKSKRKKSAKYPHNKSPIVRVHKKPRVAHNTQQFHDHNSPTDLQSSGTLHKLKYPWLYNDEDDEEEGETEINLRFFNNFSRMGPLGGVARTVAPATFIVSLGFLILSNISLAATIIVHGISSFLRNFSLAPNQSQIPQQAASSPARLTREETTTLDEKIKAIAKRWT